MVEVVVEKVEGGGNIYRVKVVDRDGKPCSSELLSYINTPTIKQLALSVKCGDKVERIVLQLQ